MSNLKAKITFGQLDLSAFLVASLAHALQLKNTPVSLNAKADASKPQVMNVEMMITGPEI
jgi:hypothetical protein